MPNGGLTMNSLTGRSCLALIELQAITLTVSTPLKVVMHNVGLPVQKRLIVSRMLQE